jgi:hypothetical protein
VYGSATVRKPARAGRSEPVRPASGRKGTPWIAARNPAMIDAQVCSVSARRRVSIARR